MKSSFSRSLNVIYWSGEEGLAQLLHMVHFALQRYVTGNKPSTHDLWRSSFAAEWRLGSCCRDG